ncbi:uncharacterized protein EI90DRAFT_2878391, partial [Cantharellus anzutake]|uniref:uncharacterized protein n=1 Tax=Cantharellus anzutake TaxID=1750568 RepID=UPI0019062934
DVVKKLHPYANIAWKILDSAYQAVRGQIERDVALHDLVDSMGDLYSFVDDVNELKNKIKSLEHVIIQISVQMTECGIFIKQYVSHGFAGGLI